MSAKTCKIQRNVLRKEIRNRKQEVISEYLIAIREQKFSLRLKFCWLMLFGHRTVYYPSRVEE